MNRLWQQYQQIGLVPLIAIGLVLGILVGLAGFGEQVGLLGALFVGALKAVAPVLVFFLVMGALGRRTLGASANIRPILLMYAVGTFVAALTAVLVSFAFPVSLTLITPETQDLVAPSTLAQVMLNLLMNLVENPISALVGANYMGILTWAILFGLAFKRVANDQTFLMLDDLSKMITMVVTWVIWTAPFGIFGIVAETVTTVGISALMGYARLLGVLLFAMVFVALVANPLIVFCKTRKNPYPLTLQCLRESGVTAFFTRSSAANIPVNMALAKKLNLDENTYSVAIPLGATVNMAGAAITINVLTLATAHTLGIEVGFGAALLLALVGSVSACGASGVAGGSLLLIPLACSLFNISDDIAMQVVAIGFVIGVVQDSAETALNSSTDILFTAAADARYAHK